MVILMLTRAGFDVIGRQGRRANRHNIRERDSERVEVEEALATMRDHHRGELIWHEASKR